jgi:hypothetical protein
MWTKIIKWARWWAKSKIKQLKIASDCYNRLKDECPSSKYHGTNR